MKILGKNLKEYFLPIKYYIIASILIVISQYYVAVPLSNQFQLPFILNLTQALWAIMVLLSVIKLTLYYDFRFKNILFLGILYSIIIHGLKAFFFRVFLFPYDGFAVGQIHWRLFDRFFYGSFLVMVIVIIIGLVFLSQKNNPEIRKAFKKL